MKCGLIFLPRVAGFDVKAFTSDTQVNHSERSVFVCLFLSLDEKDPNEEQTQEMGDDERDQAEEEDVGKDNSRDHFEDKGEVMRKCGRTIFSV